MGKKGRTANRYNNKYQIAKLILIDLCTTGVSLILCVSFISILGVKMDLDEKILYYFTYPIIAVCSFFNGFIMSRQIRVKGWLTGLAANLMFFIAMVVTHFVVGDETMESLFLLKLSLILLCGILGGITGVNKKRKIR